MGQVALDGFCPDEDYLTNEEGRNNAAIFLGDIIQGIEGTAESYVCDIFGTILMDLKRDSSCD